MNNFAPPVKKLLSQAGWRFLRSGKGDHEIWSDPATGRKVVVDHTIKSRHTRERDPEAGGSFESFLSTGP